ncbi:MAG: hypothetical protein O7G83_00925 [Proteobacteria bacterium]|nr:hypothetical protein [Pseudomonadota bacterium]
MRTILAALMFGVVAFSAVAKERGLGTYLKGQDCIELSEQGLLHYVAGLADAWFLEAFLTNGERFGWLMECMSNSPESDSLQLAAIFRTYLNEHPADMDQAGSALFFDAAVRSCNQQRLTE